RASQSRCSPHRKLESWHHVNDCCTSHSRLHYPACRTTADRMEAHRKSDRRRDDLAHPPVLLVGEFFLFAPCKYPRKVALSSVGRSKPAQTPPAHNKSSASYNTDLQG